VVSASAEPDTILISRSWNDKRMRIEEIQIGLKKDGIVLAASK